ncbi:MAG: ruvA [Planctomycetaceae bacterium]|nr:ruvA [Planctomycetaceae bacterium]
MITRITGKLVELSATEATLGIGAFEYQVFIPDFVRRQLQSKIGQDVSLRTIEYLEGNPQQGRLTPRLIGFLSSTELDFFEAICSVDGVGVKKALRAMIKPVRDVATAIEEQDVKELATLPGIGAAMAERIVAKLRRKMAKFALMIAQDLPPENATDHDVITEAYQALCMLGHSPADARQKIELAVAANKKFKSIEDLLEAIYRQQQTK